MTLPANIRVNFGAPFPATVKGGGLVAVQKTGGIWTVSLNFNALLPGLNTIVDPTNTYVLVYNVLTGATALVRASGFVTAPVARLPAAAPVVNILTSDVEIGIDATATAVSCPLPSAAAWLLANPNGLELTIFDYKGQAGAHNITPALNGADTFVQGAVPVIKSAYGLIKLRPVGASWFVRGVS